MLSPAFPLNQMVEIARFHDGAMLEEYSAVLTSQGIDYRIGSTAPVFNLMTIGSAGRRMKPSY